MSTWWPEILDAFADIGMTVSNLISIGLANIRSSHALAAQVFLHRSSHFVLQLSHSNLSNEMFLQLYVGVEWRVIKYSQVVSPQNTQLIFCDQRTPLHLMSALLVQSLSNSRILFPELSKYFHWHDRIFSIVIKTDVHIVMNIVTWHAPTQRSIFQPLLEVSQFGP